MDILHQTCCTQDYNLGFQVRKTGLLVWEKYSVRDEQLHLEREAVCILSHDKFRENSDLQRETQGFILGKFFFFLKSFYRPYINRITQDQPSVLSYVTATPCGLHWLPVEMLLLLIATQKLQSSCYWKHVYPAFKIRKQLLFWNASYLLLF